MGSKKRCGEDGDDIVHIDLSGEMPTDRADWDEPRSVQHVGLSVARGKTNVKLGIYSNAPVGSAGAGASAILQCTLACIFAAACIAGICIWSGVTPTVTVTMAMAIFVLVALPMLYVTFRTTTPAPVTTQNHEGNIL